MVERRLIDFPNPLPLRSPGTNQGVGHGKGVLAPATLLALTLSPLGVTMSAAQEQSAMRIWQLRRLRLRPVSLYERRWHWLRVQRRLPRRGHCCDDRI